MKVLSKQSAIDHIKKFEGHVYDLIIDHCGSMAERMLTEEEESNPQEYSECRDALEAEFIETLEKVINGLPEPKPEQKFPNGFSDWQETYHQIAVAIETEYIDHTRKFREDKGTGGFWELAKAMTDFFEWTYKGRDWADGAYFEAIEEYVRKTMFELLDWMGNEKGADNFIYRMEQDIRPLKATVLD